jgi:hypothetical protein
VANEMTDKATSRINIGIGLIGTILGVIVTLLGVSLTFGGKLQQIDADHKDIENIKTTSATKDDVKRIEASQLRLEQKFDKFLDGNSNQRRR